MNVFEFAMQMEADGKAFYEKHAALVDRPELKNILLEIAADEDKHYRIFEAMAKGEKAEYVESEQTTILSSVKNIFQEMKDGGAQYEFAATAKEIWAEARDVEKKAEAFYREKADEIDDEKQKQILHRIADEEHRHWVTMEHVIEFLDRPSSWLENAEWGSLDD